MSSIDIYAHPNYNILLDMCHEELFNQYINLMNKFKHNSKESGKTETHHIFPVSIFGQNNTTVNLPIKEHFNAHVLLWKMIDKTKSEEISKNWRKMANAVHKMVQGRKSVCEYAAEEYEIARIAIIEARKDTITAYDVKENKNIKIHRDKLDNKRYFSLFPMKNTVTNKACFVSVMDPEWINCIPRDSIQTYFDKTINEYVNISTKLAKKDPKRYIFRSTGKKLKGNFKNRRIRFFDEKNGIYIKCTSEEAKLNGYIGCSNYIDLDNNKIVYISKTEAKEQPWRYKHANADRFDVHLIATGECIKIHSHEYDKTKHMTRSTYRAKMKSDSSSQCLDFGD